MKNAVLLIISLCLLSVEQSYATVEAVIGSVPMQQNSNLAVTPASSRESEIIISRDQYVISYNRNRRLPNWVAWKLEDQDIGTVGRSNHFAKDLDLENYLARSGGGTAVDASEFQGSCFDRGHQIPSKDRTDSESDNAQTFLMSNMIPQTPFLNRVIWEHLENYTRDLVHLEHKKVYVIAGPIFDQNIGNIGPHHDIPVPSKDFKIIFVLNANQTAADIGPNTEVIAAIMPNALNDGSLPVLGQGCTAFKSISSGSPNDWERYKTTISEIESESGFSFGSSMGTTLAF